MRRFFIPVFACLFIIGCDREQAAPTSPSQIASLAADASGSNLTAASVPELSACLQGHPAPADCFSATRMRGPARRSSALGLSSAAASGTGPSSLVAGINGSTVSLTWTSAVAPGLASYVIEVGSASGLANLADFATNNLATIYVATGVPSGTYYVRIWALVPGALIGPSDEVVVQVGTCQPPSAPSGLAASVSGATVTLTWNAASGSPTSYVIEAGSSPGSSNLFVSNTGNTATSLTAAAAFGTYYVRVLSQNACGTSGPSNELAVVVGAPTQSTTFVLNGSLSSVSDGDVWYNGASPNSNVTVSGTVMINVTSGAIAGGVVTIGTPFNLTLTRIGQGTAGTLPILAYFSFLSGAPSGYPLLSLLFPVQNFINYRGGSPCLGTVACFGVGFSGLAFGSDPKGFDLYPLMSATLAPVPPS